MGWKTAKERRAYEKVWYRKNKAKRNALTQKNRKRIKEWYFKFKSSLSCSRCGENDPACLEFHHKDSKEKERAIACMVAACCSIERILLEIKKCEVLCANCHRKEHHAALVQR